MSNHIQKSLRAIDMNLLPILRELLYSQNVSKAAKRLHMSQPAVSEALGRLRTQYNDEILARAGRLMVITPFARSLIEPLDDILGKVESLSRPQHSYSPTEIEQDLVIATGDSVLVALGKNLINYLAEHLPKVNVQFIELQNFDVTQLKSGEVDLAIIPKTFINEDGLCNLPLYREDFVIISRKNHPDMYPGMNLKDLKKIPKVGYKAHPTSCLRVPPPPEWQEQLLITQMALLPFLVEGSNSIALIQKHVAKQFELFIDIDIHEIPNFSWTADVFIFWGSINEHSYVHRWLRERLSGMLTSNSGYDIFPCNQSMPK
jgi:DNA-binding transcriptional LysR family regulator